MPSQWDRYSLPPQQQRPDPRRERDERLARLLRGVGTALPVAGAVGGAAIGGLAGSVVPGLGTAAGLAAGGSIGGGLGQLGSMGLNAAADDRMDPHLDRDLRRQERLQRVMALMAGG